MCSLLALATGAAAAAATRMLRCRRTCHLRRDTISLLLVAIARRVDREFCLETDRRFGVTRQATEVMTAARRRKRVRPRLATGDLRMRQHRYSLLTKCMRLESVGVKRCLLLRLVQFLRVCPDKLSPFRRSVAARHLDQTRLISPFRCWFKIIRTRCAIKIKDCSQQTTRLARSRTHL